MPAIGSVWAPGTWGTDAWALDTWENAEAPVTVTKATSPTRLLWLNYEPHSFEVLTALGTRLEPIDFAGTRLTWFDDEGNEMATPIVFTAGETGPLQIALTGADGTRQNYTGATALTLRVVGVNGTVVANAVALTQTTPATGVATWTRLTAEVATAGDYRVQAKAVLSDGSIVYFPDANPELGYPMTLLAAV